MEFWTIMIVTFGSGVFADEVSLLPYPSARACGDAVEAVFDTLHPAHPELVVQCRETQEPSRVIRPMPRPADLVQP